MTHGHYPWLSMDSDVRIILALWTSQQLDRCNRWDLWDVNSRGTRGPLTHSPQWLRLQQVVTCETTKSWQVGNEAVWNKWMDSQRVPRQAGKKSTIFHFCDYLPNPEREYANITSPRISCGILTSVHRGCCGLWNINPIFQGFAPSEHGTNWLILCLLVVNT